MHRKNAKVKVFCTVKCLKIKQGSKEIFKRICFQNSQNFFSSTYYVLKSTKKNKKSDGIKYFQKRRLRKKLITEFSNEV